MNSPNLTSATRWVSLATVGRQAGQVLFVIYLARSFGPTQLGVVSLATVYAAFTAMIMDQGLAAALVATRETSRAQARSVASFNILASVLLGSVTWLLAGEVAAFFGAAGLEPVLRVLALLLPLKALAIVPRALMTRDLEFGRVAIIETTAMVLGLVAGVAVSIEHEASAAVVAQVGVADGAAAVLFLFVGRTGTPSLSLRPAFVLIPYSARIFASNVIAFGSRNIDNLAVGRVYGPAALALYALAYRAVSLPVQFVGQTARRVLFPVYARSRDDTKRIQEILVGSTRVIATIIVPVMLFVAVASPQIVSVLLGPEWNQSAPLMAILAFAGARETIWYPAPGLMAGLGRARVTLWYEVLSTSAQVAGIFIGLHYGARGVALGYALAGFAVLPVLLLILSRLTGVSPRKQLAPIGGPLLSASFGALAFLVVVRQVDGSWGQLIVGFVAYSTAFLVAFRVGFATDFQNFLGTARSFVGLGAGPKAAGGSA